MLGFLLVEYDLLILMVWGECFVMVIMVGVIFVCGLDFLGEILMEENRFVLFSFLWVFVSVLRLNILFFV